MKTWLPAVYGMIDRRILVNFRVDPDVLQSLLPAPFRPKRIHNHGMAGICLIRLKDMRVRFAPVMLGIDSENAAHRIAVEWNDGGVHREGVFIPRRDTSSQLQSRIGGRLFPGLHHRATFRVREDGEHFQVEMNSCDGTTRVEVEARLADRVQSGSIFADISEASRFFQNGSLGYSVTANAGEFDGLELDSLRWELIPLSVTRMVSSFFLNADLFPPGAAQFDSAFLMRGIEHRWLARGTLRWSGGVV